MNATNAATLSPHAAEARLGEAFASVPQMAPRSAWWSRLVREVEASFGAPACLIERRLGGAGVACSASPASPLALGEEETGAIVRALEAGWVAPPDSEETDARVLLVPVRERDEVVAVLRVAFTSPPTLEVRRRLEAVTSELSQRLTARAWALEATLVREASVRLSSLEALAEGAAAALDALVPAVEASGGALFHAHRGRMVPLADYGEQARDRRAMLGAGTPYPRGLAWRALLDERDVFTRRYADHPDALPGLPSDPAVWVVPLVRKQSARFVLVLTFPDERRPGHGDRAVVEALGPVLAGMLRAVRDEEVQERLNSLHERLPEVPADALYPHVLEAAVDCVPGAEAGLLWVRGAGEEDFEVRATLGQGLRALQGTRVPVPAVQAWYDPEDRSWGGAAPRILQPRPSTVVRRLRSFGVAKATLRRLRPEAWKADLSLPVHIGGDVRVVVSLGAASRVEAFGRDSLRVARQLGAAVASLLRVACDRDEARRDAATDPLTGLANRRGAEAELARALARAWRSDEPMLLSVLDLGEFKELNDAVGHACGDEALLRVARALVGATRAGDVVARWGGDEFVAILPRQSARHARTTEARLREAVNQVEVRGRHLRAHVGTSSFPTDALMAEDLVRLADERMYEDKFSDVGV